MIPIYAQALAYLHRQLPALFTGGVQFTTILHDDDCGINAGKECDCNFHVKHNGVVIAKFDKAADMLFIPQGLLYAPAMNFSDEGWLS